MGRPKGSANILPSAAGMRLKWGLCARECRYDGQGFEVFMHQTATAGNLKPVAKR